MPSWLTQNQIQPEASLLLSPLLSPARIQPYLSPSPWVSTSPAKIQRSPVSLFYLHAPTHPLTQKFFGPAPQDLHCPSCSSGSGLATSWSLLTSHSPKTSLLCDAHRNHILFLSGTSQVSREGIKERKDDEPGYKTLSTPRNDGDFTWGLIHSIIRYWNLGFTSWNFCVLMSWNR